jgi:hypothetical protein
LSLCGRQHYGGSAFRQTKGTAACAKWHTGKPEKEPAMKVILPVILLLVGLALAFALPGRAERLCGPEQELTDALAAQFGENVGVSRIQAEALNFYSNLSTGTWSLVVVEPDGLICVVAFGEGLEVAALQVAQ